MIEVITTTTVDVEVSFREGQVTLDSSPTISWVNRLICSCLYSQKVRPPPRTAEPSVEMFVSGSANISTSNAAS